MEAVIKERSFLDSIFIKLVDRVFRQIRLGHLKVTFDNVEYSYGNTSDRSVSITVNHIDFFKKIVLSGEVGLGEAYMENLWESNQVKDFLILLIRNQEYLGDSSAIASDAKKIGINILGVLNRIDHYFNHNSKKNSLKNISYHYDLSNEFYSLMLDETMTYSSGLFKEDGESLVESQRNKYQNLAHMLNLKKGQGILEIGSGWGGMTKYLVENYEAWVKTVTISQQQFDYATTLFRENNISDKVEIKFQDYRDIPNDDQTFDHVVSIEMIEAVGEKYLESYFDVVTKSLKKNGRFAMQAILMPSSRYEQYKKSSDWIEKYIFPGGHLPSVERLVSVASKYGLELVSFEEFGLSYARTLKIWRENFDKNIHKVKDLGFDERFIRMWRYYLIICEAAFETKNIYLAQLCFTRPNN